MAIYIMFSIQFPQKKDPDEICVHTCFSFVECGQRSSATYIFMTPMKAVFAIGFAQ